MAEYTCIFYLSKSWKDLNCHHQWTKLGKRLSTNIYRCLQLVDKPDLVTKKQVWLPSSLEESRERFPMNIELSNQSIFLIGSYHILAVLFIIIQTFAKQEYLVTTSFSLLWLQVGHTHSVNLYKRDTLK